MEKIRWTDRVKNKEVLQVVNEDLNALQAMQRDRPDWIGHISRRNWLLKKIVERKVEGRMEVTGRHGRRRKKLLDDIQETRSWKLEQVTLDCNQWRTRFGKGCGTVVR
jgi:hypothetical protein